jgi:SNF2 family DNA or RNA helicase
MSELADHQQLAVENILATARGRLIGADRALLSGGHKEAVWSALASLGVLLAHDAGAGKTRIGTTVIDRWGEIVQGYAWKSPVLAEAIARPTIVVTPASGRFVWPKESRSQVRVAESDAEIQEALGLATYSQGLSNAHRFVLVVSYTGIQRNIEAFLASKVRWSLSIFDEFHALRNRSDMTKAIWKLDLGMHVPGFLFRIGMTGTPLYNRVDQLWPMLAFLNGWITVNGTPYSPMWGREDQFTDLYTEVKHGKRVGKFLRHDPWHKVVCMAHRAEDCNSLHSKLIRVAAMQRVGLHEAWPEIAKPEANWVAVYLNSQERTLYHGIVQAKAIPVARNGTLRQMSARKAVLTYAFEACLGPQQLCYSTRNLGPVHVPDPPYQSSKIEWLVRFMSERQPDEAVLVFTAFAQFAGAISGDPRLSKYAPILLSGTSSTSTNEAQRKFQEGPSRLLISTTKGGEAITLTKATHVVFLGLYSWTPLAWVQAYRRAVRKGQTRQVQISLVYAPGSCEDWMRTVLSPKMKAAQAAIDAVEGKLDLGLDKLPPNQWLKVFGNP